MQYLFEVVQGAKLFEEFFAIRVVWSTRPDDIVEYHHAKCSLHDNGDEIET